MANKIYIQRNKRGQYLVNGKLVSKPYVYRSLSDNKVYQINPNGTRNLLSKPQPDVYKELWKTENPQKANYNNGKWYKYKDPKGWYIGPGFDYKLHGTEDFKQKVENGIGVTDQELNQQLNNYKNEVLSDVDKSLGRYTNFPDTISPQIKMGLIDVYWQSGRTGFKDWSRNKRLQKAAAEGNLEKIKENGVSYVNGKLDTRRNNERIKKFWYYSSGGILKFQFPSQPISRATDEYYNGTGWHFVRGNQLKPSDPNYSVAQRKGLDNSYLVDENGILVPEKVRSAYERNKQYQAQLPYQEQNDINDIRQMQKRQADRDVRKKHPSISKYIETAVRYPIQYIVGNIFPRSTFVDLSNKNVTTVDKNSNDNILDSILFNDFLEHNSNSFRPVYQFKNTTDTLIGDSKIPLSKISTFYGIEDGKLKMGPLDIFKDSTIVVPNRAKGGNRLLTKIIENPNYKDNTGMIKEHRKKIREEVEEIGKRLGIKPSGMAMFIHPIRSLIMGYPAPKDISDKVGYDKYWDIVDEALDKYPLDIEALEGGTNSQYKGITKDNDTISISVGKPKFFMANEKGQAAFVSNIDDNLDKINNFLSKTPAYIGLPDNGRYSHYQTTYPSYQSYRGFGTLPMYLVGTSKY